MQILEIFEKFVTAFEATIDDDNWSRLAPFLSDDVTYVNIGGPDPKCEGRDNVMTYLKNDVTNTDRRFDTRTHIALAQPLIHDNHLSRPWRCIYTLAGVPDLVVEGEARYVFENDLIKEIEEEITEESIQRTKAWMQKYGDKL